MIYRPEIDGLRAIAVVPVVLFHAGLPGFGGGFVGVDIFFVISGFLITQIIHTELLTGRFSLWKFYSRRVRRIVPALVAVLLATAVVGSFLLIPSRFSELLTTVSATALFMSNIYLWQTADYFATAAELNPLLHTWSLGVEEQFYIIFPLFIMLLTSRGDVVLKRAIIGVIGASLFFSVILAVRGQSPDANFYLLPTRAWELAIGSLLALSDQPKACSRASSFFALAGLALIVVSFVTIDASMPFPGYFAIPPVIGTALVLRYAASSNVVGRVLSQRPFVWIGLLSYSIYLWHQPVLAFTHYIPSVDISGIRILGPLLLVLALSYVSWRWIERPFRDGASEMNARTVTFTGVATLSFLASLVVFVSNDAQYQMRFNEPAQKVFAFLDYRETDDYQRQFRNGCFVSGTGRFGPFPESTCIIVDDERTNILLIGDSHAAMLALPLAELFPEVNLIQATASGCLPALGTTGEDICTTMRENVLGSLIGDSRIDRIVFAGRWQADILDAFVATASRAKEAGHAVTVFGPAPEYATDFPLLLGQAVNSEILEDTMSYFDYQRYDVEARLKERLADVQIELVSLIDLICKAESCQSFSSNGEPMQFDYGHLTLSAARDVVEAAIINGLTLN